MGSASTQLMGFSALSLWRLVMNNLPAASALPFACGRYACEKAGWMNSLEHMVWNNFHANWGPWSEVLV